MRLHQDATLMATVLAAGGRVEHALRPGRHAWVQIIRGSVTLNGTGSAAGTVVIKTPL